MSPTNYLFHKYTPDEIDEDEFLDRFVVRTEEFNDLYEKILKADYHKPQQHFIIVGQRGQGKTTLLRRLMIAIEKDEALSQFLMPVKFTEEQYQIRSLCRLWEEVADYLQSIYPQYFGDILDKMEAHFDDDDYDILCFSFLDQYVKSKNKKLLLLIDNIDELLGKLKPKEQHQLREVLMSSSTFRIIGGSTKMLEQHYDYGKPFYEFFQIVRLQGLDKNESTRFLRTIGDESQRIKINRIISDSPQRIETLRRITGGVPRTMVMLFGIFIDDEGNAFDDLLKVLDEATPLYKHRMDDLPTTLQEITHVIAMNWDGLGTKEISAKTRLQSKEVSAQLKQLENKYSIIESISIGKNKIYKLEERFFNIWYLMRFGRKKDRQKVEWLVRFLNAWCSPKELEQRAQQLLIAVKGGSVKASYAYHMCEALGYAGLQSKTEHLMKENVRGFLHKKGSDLAKIVSSSDNELLGKAQKLYGQGLIDQLIDCLINNNKQSSVSYNLLAFLYVEQKDYAQAEQYFLKSIESGDTGALNNLGVMYAEQKDYAQAEQYYLKSIESGETGTLLNLGNMYAEQKDYAQAEQYYLKSIESGETDALNNLGNMYAEQKDYAQAEQYFLKSLESGETDALNNLGNMYAEQKDYAQAEQYFLKLLESGETDALFNLGIMYAEQKDYAQAEQYYLKSLESGATNALNNLGNMYRKKKDYAQAEQYYLKSIESGDTGALNNLGIMYAEQKDYAQAEQYYLKSIESGETDALNNLGIMYAEQKDYAQAEQYYLKSIESGDTGALNNLGIMYAEQKDYAQAEQYYLKSIESGETGALLNLGIMYADQKDYAQAEQYYLKSIASGKTGTLLNLGNMYAEQKDYAQAEQYYLKSIESGDTNADNALAWFYVEQGDKLEAAMKFAKRSYSSNKSFSHAHTFATVLLWAEEFESSYRVFTKWFKLGSAIDAETDITTYFILLLAKGQYYQAKRFLEMEEYQLKDRIKPVWYALMSLMQDEFPNEIQKMGGELQETVDEMLGTIKNMEQKYAIE
jgi:TPR repeat protein